MAVSIPIRDVPDAMRDELAARAADRHQSMQEYLKGELIRLAQSPTAEQWLARVRERLQEHPTRVTRDDIVDAVRSGRE